jgi:hypothetical protein
MSKELPTDIYINIIDEISSRANSASELFNLCKSNTTIYDTCKKRFLILLNN